MGKAVGASPTLPAETRQDVTPSTAGTAGTIQDCFAAPLRALYEPYEKGPIPDEHVTLLLALRWKERERQVGRDAGV